MREEISNINKNSSKKLFQPSTFEAKSNSFAYDKSLIALSSSWGGLIANLGVQIGNFYTIIETLDTAPNIPLNGNWVQIVGQSDLGGFTIYISSDAAASFLKLSHDELDVSKLEGNDAALILEYLFTGQLYSLEEILGTNLKLNTVTDINTPVMDEVFGFQFELNGKFEKAALSVEGHLHNVLESVIAPLSFPDERKLDNRLIVHLGPVVVPARQAYLARIGEMIDCGVEPSDVIKGVLMRSDNRYWPIYIEDEKIEIVGDLAGPVDFSQQDPNQENIFVTFGLGEVTLSAYDRSTIGIGTVINIARLENNSANIYYQARPFGKGHLSILGTNLAVTLDSVGAFKP